MVENKMVLLGCSLIWVLVILVNPIVQIYQFIHYCIVSTFSIYCARLEVYINAMLLFLFQVRVYVHFS
jgi:hypothetical protein